LAAAVTEAVRLGEEHHVFGTVSAQSRIIETRSEQVRGPFFRSQLAVGAAGSIYQGLVFVLLVAGLAGLYAAGTTEFGAVGASVLILMRSLAYGQLAQSAYTDMHNHLPYIDLTVAALRRYVQSAGPSGERALPEIRQFRLHRVSYFYAPQRPGLIDVTFKVSAGAAVGVVGASGAGKSTLVQILLRLRHPDQGNYLINGEDAACYDHDAWSRLVAYVPQEPKLIAGTVAANIRFHRDGIDQSAIEEAARLAHVHDDILKWTSGYERVVGQRADAVSGGQRQRICLARALATRPQVLVLDEPTSALDPRSELLVRQSLLTLKSRGVTLFIVAHRPTTLEVVDLLLHLDHGRLVGSVLPGRASATQDLIDFAGPEVRG